LRQLVGANWILVAYFKNFYARDKGLVKQDLYDDTNALISGMEVRRLVIY
jgi:hypothetical protein